MADRPDFLRYLLSILLAPRTLRHFVESTEANHALGRASEEGVKEVLRRILPERIGITSGYLRTKSEENILDPASEQGSLLGPQADVLIYDKFFSGPIYEMEGADLLFPEDVSVAIEVKDWKRGEDALVEPEGSGKASGAIGHIAEVSRHCAYILQGVLMFRGSGIEKAKNVLETASITATETRPKSKRSAPHLVVNLCENEVNSYIGFSDWAAESFQIYSFSDQRKTMLAFFRVILSYLAISNSLSSSALGDFELELEKYCETSESIEIGGASDSRNLIDEIDSENARVGIKNKITDFFRSFENTQFHLLLSYHIIELPEGPTACCVLKFNQTQSNGSGENYHCLFAPNDLNQLKLYRSNGSEHSFGLPPARIEEFSRSLVEKVESLQGPLRHSERMREGFERAFDKGFSSASQEDEN